MYFKPEKDVYLENLDSKILPLTNIQKIIAKRMSASKHNKPCFYLEAKADITDMMYLRPTLKKQLGVKITTNSFYIVALAHAVREFPRMAGKVNGDSVTLREDINIGFAVNAPHGLVVPVIKHADRKNLADIAREEKDLTEKARSNQLTLNDMAEETVALSNLGSYGVDSFIGIVPPPASTILSVGNAFNTVVPQHNGFEARKILSLTLAVDHRIIDYFYAAEFLCHVKKRLEMPQYLI